MTIPIPPRYRWLKRIAIALPIAFVALALLRWAWGAYADARLQSTIDRYRAAGEPVLPEEFIQPPIPDARNAAKFLLQAVTARPMQTSATTLDYESLCYDPFLAIEYPDEAAQALVTMGNTLTIVRVARLAPECNWEFSPSANNSATPYGHLRSLAQLACAAASTAHLREDDAAAIEYSHDGLAVASRSSEIGTLISMLVAIACDALVCHNVQFIAPSLQVRNETSNTAAAPRERVIALIQLLLDVDSQRARWRHCLLSERAYTLSMLEEMTKGHDLWAGWWGTGGGATTWPSRVLATAVSPHWKLQVVAPLDQISVMASWSFPERVLQFARQAQSSSDSFEVPSSIWEVWVRPFECETYGHVAENALTNLALRRFAAIALAIRMYELDHDRQPAALNDLVPAYLPDVPTDPYASDGAPIRFVLDARKPRLYSIGLDGIDDGGEPAGGGFRNEDGRDLVFSLIPVITEHPVWSPDPPASATPSSPEAAEDQPQIEDAHAGNQRQSAADEP